MLKLVKKVRYYIYFSINKMIFNINKVKIGSNFKINGIITVKNKGICKIGEDFKCNAGKNYNPIGGDTICRLIVNKNARLVIGSNVGVSNSTIVAMHSIVIEDNVLIGGSCKIYDTDFHSLNTYERINDDNKIISKPIKISKNVFIGSHTIILKGVQIGENSIIGAGSVVAKDIPANEIWAGNPIKFIKKVPTINDEF